MSTEPEQRTIDKTDWPEGPWMTEPDRLEFKHAGLPCLITRSEHGGNLCGYVAVPPEHPAHGKNYHEVDVGVHGGLTYADACQGHICHVPAPGEPDNVWWLGFDCHHGFDFAPGTQATFKKAGLPELSLTAFPGMQYRDIEYVKEQCRNLAEQLSEMGK